MTDKTDRMLELLTFIGYSVEFPPALAKRISGHPEWNRHVMYRAIREEYVSVYRKAGKRYVIKSLNLTDKGLKYIERRDPESLAMIYSRRDSIGPIYKSNTDKLNRLHAIAIGMVMAHAAGAAIFPSEKPSLMKWDGYSGKLAPDPSVAYYYSPQEIRAALLEVDDLTTVKGARLIGIIVRGHRCHCMYYTGKSRMFWMRLSEENYASSVMSLLNVRSFKVTTLTQIIVGYNMALAAKLCRSPNPFGDRFFKVSNFFDACNYLTDNIEGDDLLRLITNPEQALEFNRRILAPYAPPRITTREYDAVELQSNRPVILNYTCDLIQLTLARSSPNGFDGGPIMLCFDYQVQTVQNILGASVEVRPILKE